MWLNSCAEGDGYCDDTEEHRMVPLTPAQRRRMARLPPTRGVPLEPAPLPTHIMQPTIWPVLIFGALAAVAIWGAHKFPSRNPLTGDW